MFRDVDVRDYLVLSCHISGDPPSSKGTKAECGVVAVDTHCLRVEREMGLADKKSGGRSWEATDVCWTSKTT
jgi:hypothetical protein